MYSKKAEHCGNTLKPERIAKTRKNYGHENTIWDGVIYNFLLLEVPFVRHKWGELSDGCHKAGWDEVTLTPIYPGPSLTGRTFPNPGWHLPTNIGITPPDISAFPITGVATLLWDAPPERLTDTSRTCFESQTQSTEWRTARVAKICQADKTWVTARPHTWLQSSPSLTQLRKFPSQDSVILHLIWPPSVWDLLLHKLRHVFVLL